MASRFESAFTAYRIVRAGLPAFDGGGAFRWGGRWTSPGRSVIHAAESYSLAILENLVHFNLGELPPHLVVVRLQIPAAVSRQIIEADQLPGWDGPTPNPVSRAHGDQWYDERRSAVLIVPSVLSPFDCNVLIHQEHPESRAIEVGKPLPATLDERLRALVRGGGGRRS
jgi:RES domain-containing protein